MVRYSNCQGHDPQQGSSSSASASGSSSSKNGSSSNGGGSGESSSSGYRSSKSKSSVDSNGGHHHHHHHRNGSATNGHANGSAAQANGANVHWKFAKVFIEQDDSALINRKLPKELLLRVFSHLDVVSLCRCAQVSKAWNILALDGSNWQRVDLFEFQRDIESVVVENVAKRCGGFLRKLSLRGCQHVGDSALATFSLYCNNIESLKLTDCKQISDRTSHSLATYCHKLQFLDLSSCSLITDHSLVSLAKGCRNLIHVDVSWCEQVTGMGVKALAEECHKLQNFISKGCLNIHDDGLFHLARHCPELRKITLHSCRNIQDEGIIRLAESCKELQYLCVSNCTHLTDASLLALANHCPKLATLECAAIIQFTDTGFQVGKKQKCFGRLFFAIFRYSVQIGIAIDRLDTEMFFFQAKLFFPIKIDFVLSALSVFLTRQGFVRTILYLTNAQESKSVELGGGRPYLLDSLSPQLLQFWCIFNAF